MDGVGLRQANNGCLSVSRLPDDIGESVRQSVLLYRSRRWHDRITGKFEIKFFYFSISFGQSEVNWYILNIQVESSRNLVRFDINLTLTTYCFISSSVFFYSQLLLHFISRIFIALDGEKFGIFFFQKVFFMFFFRRQI